MELTKADKKLCRQLMHVAIERECEKFVKDIQKLASKSIPMSELNQPYQEENGHHVQGPWHKRYIDIFRKVQIFDKHIAQRYDGVSGSSYIQCILDLYCNGIITDEDIAPFSEEPRNLLINLKKGI